MSKDVKITKPDLAAAPLFSVTPLDAQRLKDGIIVRVPNWLGDAIMTLPALMQLKKIIPDGCGLFVVCPASLAELFKALPIVDMVFPIAKAHRAWTSSELRNVMKIFAGAGILFNNSLRDAIHFRLAGINPLYGAAARCRGLLLKRSFKFPRRKDQLLNELHHANKYLSIVKALGAPDWHGELPEFKITPSLEDLRPELQALCGHPRLLALAAGAAYGSSKRWESGKFKIVAEWWIKQGGIVAVLGSAKEREICQEAVAGLAPDQTFNLAGKTEMPELMHLLKHAAVCVANDSGIMHLAAALGCPGVAIFGPTDHSATSPISARWKIVYQKQPCSPCFKRECPKGNPICMNMITPQMVIAELEKMCFKRCDYSPKVASSDAT